MNRILAHSFGGTLLRCLSLCGEESSLSSSTRAGETADLSNSEQNQKPSDQMMSRLGLCVLGLLCLHTLVFGQNAAQVPPGVLIFCDDPSVEKAVTSAVNKFNEGLMAGNILALFQIISAAKSENGADSVYSLFFTSRKTDCLVGSNKPWTECDYLPHGRKEPFLCNATVHMTETEANTTLVDCRSDPLITSEKSACLGCPEDIDENSEDLKTPISVSISKYNSMSDSTHLFSLHTVGQATRQVVAGFRFKFIFDMRKTVCAKADHNELSDLCSHDNDNLEFAHCNSTVDVAPWRLEPPQAHIECAEGAIPPSVLKRRPPGWSPLRNFENGDPASAASPTMGPAAPSPPKAPNAKKEESSEENTKGKKPSASPDAANKNPFHCPSKPWKPFTPISSSGPLKDTTDATPIGFQDTDLLGSA